MNTLLESVGCETCMQQATLIDDAVHNLNGRGYKETKGLLITTCMVLQWRDLEVCKKYVDLYPDLIVKNLFRGYLGPQFFC